MLDLDSAGSVSPSIPRPIFTTFGPSRPWPQPALSSCISPAPGREGGLSGQRCAALDVPRGPEGTSGHKAESLLLEHLMISPHLTKLPALWLDGKLAGVPDAGRGGWWVHYGAGAEGHFFLICCYTSVPRTEPGMWELIVFQMLLIIKKVFENLGKVLEYLDQSQ